MPLDMVAFKDYQRRYRQNNRARLTEKARQWRSNNPEKVAARNRRDGLKKYNLTVEEYDHLLAKQDGRCGICRTLHPGLRNKFFCVDHDHQTGIIRGLLCYSCNVALGHFRDNPEVLMKAITYLTENQEEAAMPRGIYDRSKSKTKKAAAPVVETKKTKAASGEVAKTRVSAKTKTGTDIAQAVAKPAMYIPPVDAAYGFNILGAGISTLSDAYTQVKDNTELANLITVELVETVRTLTALRCATFGDLAKTEVPAQEEVTPEEPEEVAAPPAPAPVATLPSLPQPSSVSAPVLPGNAAPFQPPAPPLPHH